MKTNWNGILKITHAQHIRNNEVIWEDKNLYNILHSQGEELFLKNLFYNDGTLPTPIYYLGLDSRAAIAYADSMTSLVGEPTGSGYTRQPLNSISTGNTGWTISAETSIHKALSNVVSFVASGGSYGPMYNLFLTNKSDNTGSLISSVSLSTPSTLISGDVLSLRMTLSLRDCP